MVPRRDRSRVAWVPSCTVFELSPLLQRCERAEALDGRLHFAPGIPRQGRVRERVDVGRGIHVGAIRTTRSGFAAGPNFGPQAAMPRDSASRHLRAYRPADTRFRTCEPEFLGACFRTPVSTSHAARFSTIWLSVGGGWKTGRRHPLDIHRGPNPERTFRSLQRFELVCGT